MLSYCKIPAQKYSRVKINWTLSGSLPSQHTSLQSGLAGVFSGASGDIMWIAGGSNFSNGLPWEGGSKLFYDTVFYFKKNKQGITLLPQRGHLPVALAYGSSIAIEGGVVCLGGQNASGFSKKAVLATLKTGEASLRYQSLPDLPDGIANAAGTSYRNTIYLAGGETVSGPVDQFLSLDITNPGKGWQNMAKLPMPVSHAILVTQYNGKDTSLYLVGGRRKDISGISEIYATVFRYHTDSDTWEPCPAMPYALAAHTGVAGPENRIFIFGGDKGEVFGKVEKVLVAIDHETDPVKRSELVKVKNVLQNTHPGFSRGILMYNTVTGKWKEIAKLPFPAAVTTHAFIWGKEMVIPSGEIRAGVRSPEIWMGKIE